MKRILFFVSIFLMAVSVKLWAEQGLPSTDDQIATLKADILAGKLEVAKTRLSDFVKIYGEAPTITNNDKSVIVEYPGIKIEFEKSRYWKSWQYDTSRSPVYTKDVNSLRKDLESQKLVGDNITFAKVRKDYGEPTFSLETTEDGDTSTYYYGDIKMVFENRIKLKKYEGKNLVEVSKGLSNSAPKTETKIEKPAPVTPPVPVAKKVEAKKEDMKKDVVVSQKMEGDAPASK